MARGSIYTSALSASIGDMVYVPGKVDSQESDILEESKEDSVQDDFADKDGLGVIISNMEAITNLRGNQYIPRTGDENQRDDAIMNSPQKPNCTASTKTGLFSKATVVEHADNMAAEMT